MSTVDEYFKKINKDTAANVQSQVDIVNNSAAKSSQIVKDDYNAQIKEAEQSYNELFDQNSVQRIINERTIAENMANAGLTDSGLNRTQLTANQLSYANNQSKISRQQQSAVDTLARAMNSKLAEIETNRATQETSIRTQAFNNNYAQAVSMYNSEQKAIADSIAAAQKQQQDDYDKVMAALGNKNYTPALKEQFVKNYQTTYKLTDDQVLELFGSSNTKYVYSDDELEGQYGAPLYSDETILQAVNQYFANGKDIDKLGIYAQNLANQNGWGSDTMNAFIDAILNKADEAIALSKDPVANPTLFNNLEVISKPDKYKGRVANTAKVKDKSTGNEYTIEDIYYMYKVMYAKEKVAKEQVSGYDKLSPEMKQYYLNNVAETDWKSYVATEEIKNKAKDTIEEIQKTLGITK